MSFEDSAYRLGTAAVNSESARDQLAEVISHIIDHTDNFHTLALDSQEDRDTCADLLATGIMQAAGVIALDATTETVQAMAAEVLEADKVLSEA